MAVTLKIGIEASAESAVKAIGKIGDVSLHTKEKINTLSKEFIKLDRANAIFGEENTAARLKVQEDFRTNLERTIETMKLMKGDLKGLEAVLKSMEKIDTEHLLLGYDKEFTTELLNRTQLIRKEVEELKKQADAAKDAEEAERTLGTAWSEAAKQHAREVEEIEKANRAYDSYVRKLKEAEAAKKEAEELAKIEAEVKEHDQLEKEIVLAKKKHEEEKAHNAAVQLHHEEMARKRKEAEEAQRHAIELAKIEADLAEEIAMDKERTAKQQKAIAEFQNTVSNASQMQEEHDVMVALGNQAGILQERYKVLELQLRDSIKTTGVSSDRTRQLAGEMNRLSEEIKKANYTPFNVRIKNLLSSFVSAQAILWSVRSAFRLVTNTITDSMKAASEAEETWNLFVTTFNDIEVSALRASTAIASSMGLATSTVQKALGVFGDLALGYGQTDAAALEFADTLTKATLDLISFKNLTGSYDEIFSSIASGIAGNVENFRKYGVVITQAEVKTRLQQKGLDKLTGSSLQFAQMQERMAIFIEKTANAQGDMIKTMESTENVTRRLSEATKEWKENFGENWNKVLTPVKSAIADYIEEINRAQKATDEFIAGSTNISVYSDLTPEEREEKLSKALAGARSSNRDQYLANIEKIFKTYQTGYDELLSLAKGVDLSALERNETSLREIEQTYKAENNVVKALEEKNQSLAALYQTYSNLADTLNEIEGINFSHKWLDAKAAKNGNDVTGSVASHQIMNDAKLFKELEALIADITDKDLSAFSTAVENALNIESEADQMEGQLESIKKLWEELYNYFALDGDVTKDEQAILDEVAKSYDTVNARLDDHNAKIEEEKDRLAAVESALKSITGTASSYGSKLAELNLESEIARSMPGASESMIDNELARQLALNEVNALGVLFTELDAETQKAVDAINDYYDAVKRNIEIEELKEKAGTVRDSLKNQQTVTSLLMDAMAWNQTPMIPTFSANAAAQSRGAELYSELGSVIDDLTKELEELGVTDAKIEEYVGIIREQGLADIRSIVSEVEKEEYNKPWKDAETTLMGGLGEFGDIIEIFASDASGLGKLAAILAELLVQAEAFQELALILTNEILPVTNAFIRPLIPMIEVVGGLIREITVKILTPLFPVLKEIIKLGVMVVSIAQMISGVISDTFKIVAGMVITGVTELINGVLKLIDKIPFVDVSYIDNQWAKDWATTDLAGNARDKLSEMNEHLASIDKMTMEVADNTDPTKDETLRVYQDLYSRQMLSATEYAGLLSSLTGSNYDKVGVLSSGLTYQRKGSGAYVAKQNISITINGTGLSQSELSAAIRDALEESNSYGGNTYAVGIA